MKCGIYAGSFDPITNGHIWMIEEGAKLFDHLIIAIGENPYKKNHFFCITERLCMLKKCIEHLENVSVEIFSGKYLVNYAKEKDVSYILRGIRKESDYEQERNIRYINEDIQNDISTIFLIPPRNLVEVSSSMVKGLIGFKNWYKIIIKYIPQPIFRELIKREYESDFSKAWSLIHSGVSPKVSYSIVLEDLLDRYLQKGRYYHNITHILDCLNELERTTDYYFNNDSLGVIIQYFLALWFHDAVYDSHQNNNEQLSAHLFIKYAKESGIPEVHITSIISLIRATRNHETTSVSENLIIDIDLSILGKDWETFCEYDNNIAKEYAWVSKDIYIEKRLKVLEKFLLKDRIFKTPYFFQKYEKTARENIKRLIGYKKSEVAK